MNQDQNCIFCKIISKELPADIFYEDEHTVAFLDLHPNTKGHSLVVPKEHFPNIYETPSETLTHIMETAKKVSAHLKNKLGAEGVNVAQNNDSAAGQVIFHIHFHIIPRYPNDGLKHWGHINMSAEELNKIKNEIQM
jgi:histidine triad (HIT) family protein